MPSAAAAAWLLLLAAEARAKPALADRNALCATWAEQGECHANPNYMQATCALSCSTATSTVPQIRKECKGYAEQGECSRNPAFMLSTCKAECDAWEAKTGLRIDRKGGCVEWSLTGRCEREPELMAQQCNTSCTVHQRCARNTFTGWSIGVCDKALRCEAADKQRDCAALAAQGACRSDATRMAQRCLATCAALDVDAVLSAQRPRMRTRLSSVIDVPSSLSRRQEATSYRLQVTGYRLQVCRLQVAGCNVTSYK